MKKKFFDTLKKKVAVIIVVLGITITALGFGYPTAYWTSQGAYSGLDLQSDQFKNAQQISYYKWDSGNQIKIHDTAAAIEVMANNVYIDGVTYTEKLSLNNNPSPIVDNVLIKISGGQYLLIPGLDTPKNVKVGDSFIADGEIRMIIGKDSSNREVRREIVQVDLADLEPNNTDNVFLGVGILGLAIIFIGLGVWMFFVFVPEDTGPGYKNIHDERKKEFLDQVSSQSQKKEYACPVCGLNMSYKQEFNKWYCEICNKLY